MSTSGKKEYGGRAEEIVVVGVPFDANSSFLRGSAAAPRRIREAFGCQSSNLWTETGVDLGDLKGWRMGDDVDCSDRAAAMEGIERHIAALLKQNARVISLGGDHSITAATIGAYGRAFGELTLVYVDAHPDLYDELDGNRDSHASSCARIMERNLVARLVQVGIRTLNGHQREQARRFGVEIIEMREIDKVGALEARGAVYLSVDLDCLDPAFAPGVSHHEPGGLATRDLLGMIHRLPGTLVGADIVEYNPSRDVNGMTAMVAGKLLKEILGRMAGDALRLHNVADKQ